jgi:hypothetical protein
VLSLVFRAPLRFLQLYFLRLGFLDGIPGLHVCAYTAFYTFMKQARLWELEYARRQPDAEAAASAPEVIPLATGHAARATREGGERLRAA